jgi:hypothetical protein
MESIGMIDKGRECMKEGKKKEGEEIEASRPTACPVLARQKIGFRTATGFAYRQGRR